MIINGRTPRYIIDSITPGSVITDEDGFVGLVVVNRVGSFGPQERPTCVMTTTGERYSWGELLFEPRIYKLVYLHSERSKE